MHKTKRFISSAFIGLLLVAGIWLLYQQPTLARETVSRQQSLLQAYAPAGSTAAGKDSPVVVGQRTVASAVSPVVVNFADAKISTEDPDSMYNRWLRGELDLDENDGIISELEMQKLVEEALQMPPSKNVQLAASQPAALAPISAGVAFASMDYNNSGGSVPPDPEMAAGPNHVIATVNVAVAIYNKTTGTAVLGPTAAGNLFSQAVCKTGLYDPNVIYDEEAQRWILAYDKGAQSAAGGYCVLASLTSDPTGSWYEYFFPTNSSGGWLDYPHAGVGDDYIFMGGNIFSLANAFVEGRIFAFNKANLYAGSPVTMIAQGLGSGIDSPQPLELHGSGSGTWPNFGSTHYFLGEPYDGANYTVLKWDTVTLTNNGNINLGAGGMPVNSVQSGGGTLQANDYRPLDFEYRNGYGWTTMTISCNPGSGTVNCVRWAQINFVSSTPPTLGPAGSGVYSSNGDYRTFPDLAVNSCGDMAVGYTKTSASIFPAVWVTGRESGNPINTLQAESQVKAGEIFYTSFEAAAPRRWGDYTGMAIDPDGLTFWYLGEYSKNTGTTNGRWGTWIASFKYANCGSETLAGQVTDSSSSAPILNATVAISRTGSVVGSVSTNALGNYVIKAPAGTYDATASAYGYTSQTVPGIALSGGVTVTQNFALSPLPSYTVSGVVTDAATGWPLYARIDIPGYPGTPVWTNPVSGAYSVILPAGTYNFTVSAWVSGYTNATRTVVLSANTTENFALGVNTATCVAPGYVLNLGICNTPTGGLVIGNVYNGNTTTGLNGATVLNVDGYSTTSAATPLDPNVADGFYTLYSPAGVKLFTASYPGYLNGTASPTVLANSTIRQDFNLFTSPTTITTVCTTPNLAIPDNIPAGVNTTLTFTQLGSIADVNLYLRGTHTWVGDLIFTLTHPNGTTAVTAVDRPGVPATTVGCANNNFDLWLDDTGINGPVESQCSATSPALFGRATPNNLLSAFNGLAANGVWTVNVSDRAGADTGTLQEWCLEITSAGAAWRGTQNSNWNNPQNWASGAVPTAAANVTLDPNYLNGVKAWPILEVDPTVASLTLQANAELTIPNGRSLTVTGTLTNNGLLRQTINNVAGPTTFLGMGGYGGVEINPAGSMGNTTVVIRGNQACTNNPTSQHVQRCFDITPTTMQTAVIRFYYLAGEANGNPENGVSVYHWNGGSWDLQSGTTTRSSGSAPRWVEVTGVSSYSPFVLDNQTPTAVSLSQFTAGGSASGTAVLLIAGLVTFMLLSLMALTRRKR